MHDCFSIKSEMFVEIIDATCLTKMLDAKRSSFLACDRAKPCQNRRMSVNDGDDCAMGRQLAEHSLNMTPGAPVATNSRNSSNRCENCHVM